MSRDLGKILLAAALMGLLVAGGWWAWSRFVPPSKVSDALALLVLIVAGVAVYGGMIWGLKIEGRDDLAGIMNKLRRKAAGRAD